MTDVTFVGRSSIRSFPAANDPNKLTQPLTSTRNKKVSKK